MHFVVTCDNEASVAAANSMMYVEGRRAAAMCFWEVRGSNIITLPLMLQLLLVSLLTVIIFILFTPTIQELLHWLILVDIRFSISKSDIDDGASLNFP